MPSITSGSGGSKIMNGIHNALERLSAPTPGSPAPDSASNGALLSDRVSAPGYASAAPPAADCASVVSAPADDVQQAPAPPAMPCCDWPDQVRHVESVEVCRAQTGGSTCAWQLSICMSDGNVSDATVTTRAGSDRSGRPDGAWH
jgi:hypothetical protein